jgi:hypothetical protein
MIHRRFTYRTGLLVSTLILAFQMGCQPNANSAMKMESIRLSLDTPAAGWTVNPIEAWETDETIFCLFQLAPPEGMAAQVISKIESEMLIPSSTKTKRLVVLGKSWKWGADPNIDFHEHRDSFRNSIPESATRIDFQRPDASER